jgi:hypothetical protein
VRVSAGAKVPSVLQRFQEVAEAGEAGWREKRKEKVGDC